MVTMREVWLYLNGTIEGAKDFTIENDAQLYIWSYAKSHGYPEGTIHAANISVRAGGKFEPLTVDGATARMTLQLTNLIINGRGYVRSNDLKVITTNLTIDLSGNMS